MRKLWFFFIGLILFSSCVPGSNQPFSPSPEPNNSSTPSPTVSISEPSTEITKTFIPSQTPTPLVTAFDIQPSPSPNPNPELMIHSPLKDIEIQDLHLIISNPFDMPVIGKDDGHHGVDFAFYQFKDFGNINHHPVQAIFSGKVAATTENLPPYGNMLVIESSGDILNHPYAEDLIYTLPLTEYSPSPQLSCPAGLTLPSNIDLSNLSVYLLYAHLEEKPRFSIGDPIFSGEEIGLVGNTGMSGNPHLHLEFRVGPANFQFDSMGHYDTSLSQEQITSYCIWRVSGWFNPMDPMLFANQVNKAEN